MASFKLVCLLVLVVAVALSQGVAAGDKPVKPPQEDQSDGEHSGSDESSGSNESSGSGSSETNEGGGDPAEPNCDSCCKDTEEALAVCKEENAECQEALKNCTAEKEELENELQEIRDCLGKVKNLPIVTLTTGLYYFSGNGNAHRTWGGASQFCASLGLQLVSVETAAENDAIKEHIVRSGALGGANFWTGGSDAGHKGSFSWSATQEGFNFADWVSGQPSLEAGEGCVTFWNNNGQLGWADFSCNAHNPFICELPGCGGIFG